MYNNNINFIESKLNSWFLQPHLLEQDYIYFKKPSVFTHHVQLDVDTFHWFFNQLNENSLTWELKQILISNNLMFISCHKFQCPYFMITFDGTFYSKFQLFLDTIFLPSFKQYTQFEEGLLVNDQLEYFIVFERLAYSLVIKIYITQYSSCQYDIPRKLWVDFIVQGSFLNVSTEEKIKRCFIFNHLMEHYSWFNIDEYISISHYTRYATEDCDCFWEWRLVTNFRYNFYFLKDDPYDSDIHGEQYGSKENYETQMRNQRVCFQQHLFYVPKELWGLFNYSQSGFSVSANNKMLLRRAFLLLQDTDYYFEDDTFELIKSFWNGLGIKKRFDGSPLFKENLKNCADKFLELTKAPELMKSKTVKEFVIDDVVLCKETYEAEIEFFLECLNNTNNFCLHNQLLIWWLAQENMYGDFSCHFFSYLNRMKLVQPWFYKELRTSHLKEPIALNTSFTDKEIKITLPLIGVDEICELGCTNIYSTIDPYKDWIKYNKNEIWYYDEKLKPKTEQQKILEEFLEQTKNNPKKVFYS